MQGNLLCHNALNSCLLSQDFKPKGSPIKYRILENSVLMASKAKPNVEKALAQFMEIATTEVFKIGDKISHSY